MTSSSAARRKSNDDSFGRPIHAPADHLPESSALNGEHPMDRKWIEPVGKWAIPALLFLASLWLWDRFGVWNEIPHYIVPRPGLVLDTLLADWPVLSRALGVTLSITLMALAVAVAGGDGEPPPRRRLVHVEAVERGDQTGAIGAEQLGKPALQDGAAALRGQPGQVGRAVSARRQAVRHRRGSRPGPARRW